MYPVDFPYVDDFCDDEVYVFSTMGQGPSGEVGNPGPKGDKGDRGNDGLIVESVNTLIGTSEINNAAIRFRFSTDYEDTLQGCTPFSQAQNYSYDSNSLFFGAMMGSDTNKKFKVFDTNGNVLSSIDFPDGHFGCLTYDNEYHLYTLNYTSGASTRGTLFCINVADPENSYIEREIQLPSRIRNTATYNFWHNGKMCFGVRTGKIVEFYDWDLVSDDFEFVCVITQPEYPTKGRFFAHYTYCEKYDVLIWSGYGPNGMLIYDMNGKMVNSITVSDILNFARLGEIEGVVCYGDKMWIGSRTPANFIHDRNYIGFFFYDFETGMQNPFLPGTAFNYRVYVDQAAAPYGTNDVYKSNSAYDSNANFPIFTFFEDAVNYLKHLHNHGFVSSSDTLYIKGDYPYIAVGQGLENVSITRDGSGSVPSLLLYDCHNVYVNGNVQRFEDGVTYKYNNVNTWLLLAYCSSIFLSNLPATTDGSWNAVVTFSDLSVASIKNCLFRNLSNIFATIVENCTVEANAHVFANEANYVNNTETSGMKFFGTRI